MTRTALVGIGAVVLTFVLGMSVSAFDMADSRTRLTFSAPIALPGVVLPAGTYTFEVVDNPSTRNLVSVRSRDGRRHYLTTLTLPVERARAGDTRQIVFGESRPGVAPPIAIWYPIGSALGHAFLY